MPNVLLVNGEHNIVHAFKRLLHKESYNILVASSVKEATKILSTQSSHVIISDEMIERKSGIKFFSKVSSEYPDIKLIILPGNANLETVKKSIENALS